MREPRTSDRYHDRPFAAQSSPAGKKSRKTSGTRVHFRRRHTFASLWGDCLRLHFASLWRTNARGDYVAHVVKLLRNPHGEWCYYVTHVVMLCYKVNPLSSVTRRPLFHKVNLPSCVARRPLCHKVNLPRYEVVPQNKSTEISDIRYYICEIWSSARRHHIIMTCDVYATGQRNS